MAKVLSKEKIGQIIGAKHRETVSTPFYFAPPFLNEIRDDLSKRLASKGGRPGVSNWDIVRKTRYSKKTWRALNQMAAAWSTGHASVSPAQVAARIVEAVVQA